jgi:hypothetical protein
VDKKGLLAAAFVFGFGSSGAVSAADIYADFPITVKDYSGSKTSSVSYTGQAARHLLHESLKKLAGKGNGQPNADLEAQMMSYYAAKDEGRSIMAPGENGEFVFLQSGIDDISKGKNLSGKTYKGAVTAWPGNLTGPEVVELWISKAAAADGGYDLANGYNYPQLISKFTMGAVFYNQIADNYLDEKLEADNKPNDKPYKDGAAYTGKEHSWDEGFGYFGAAAHTSTLSAKQSYELAKRGTKSDSAKAALELADYNGDGKVDYVSEMTYALAYYASSYDKGGKTDYLNTVNQAFLDGRKLITAANGEKLSDSERSTLKGYAATIKDGLEKILAESVFKYAGETFEDIEKIQTIMNSGGRTHDVVKNYIKHWGELKGFAMSLQMGGKDLGETAVRLNRLIGYGPVMPNNSQVVDIDSSGNFVKDQGSGLDEYSLHILKVQNLMVDVFGVKAKSHDQLAKFDELTDQLGGGSSAEND